MQNHANINQYDKNLSLSPISVVLKEIELDMLTIFNLTK